ncbi:MAG: cell wall-binding protein [Lachnospiraceae bacterium]|nr:cell wall-binding protein [Lachnospiraceae bacterium]
MKRYLIPVLALLMVAAGTITARADWVQNGNDYYYYNGDQLVTNQIVEDEYYVDGNGKLSCNVWVNIQEENDTYYYYFDSNGKMVRDKWKTINEKAYHFNDEGHMETGWILDNMYFCHLDDGHMLTGWQRLEDPSDEQQTGPLDDSNIHWYYFSASGKKYCAGEGEDFAERRVDGKRYCFNEMGALQTGWVKVYDEYDESIGNYKYYKSDGTDLTGWCALNPPDELSEHYAYDVMWFYFNSAGVPYYDNDGIPTESDIKRISLKNSSKKGRYYFNQWGTPVWGLCKLYTDEYESDYEAYFFGEFKESCIQTGKFQLYDGNDTPDTFYFGKSGAGYTGVHNSMLYYKGKLQYAEKDMKYEVVCVDDLNYLINKSGQIVKNKTVTDGMGTKWTSSAAGVVYLKDGKRYDGHGREPDEPSFKG